MAVPNPDSSYGLDTSDHTTDGWKGTGTDLALQNKARLAGSVSEGGQLQQEGGSSFGQAMLRLAKVAYAQGTLFHQTAVRPEWVRSYRAYASKHFDGSKYNSKEFLGRSKLFRPKTRSAVRRKMAQAATALFSTGDIVAISAQNESDDFQIASASVKQELINYRLSRNTDRNGIRWFMICMGALQDATIAGICISKQTWKFKERKEIRRAHGVDRLTGLPKTIEYEASRIEVDRPDIYLFPPENVIFDPNTDWTDPAQKSRYVDLRYQMSADEAYDFIENNLANDRIPFFTISKEELQTHVESSGPADTLAARAARQQGKDPALLTSGEFGSLWLHEWFIRWEGEDWTFWTINNTVLLSEPRPTREVYPEQGGARPIAIGYGSLEAHRAYPTSPVASWQQLQAEVNDQVNLRLDHFKQVTAPPMQVRRGRKVDLTQVQRRGPNGVIMVNDIGDVEPLPIPDVPQSAFVENNYTNQDFDDLAGAFNPTGTEQSNQGASETLGGLSLLANNANSMGEFDLTVFVETWVAPVLGQLVKLEEMYESDATVLAICGERAKLYQKFNIDVVTDQMLMAESTVTIKAGIGASSHPMERLQKMGAAFQMATQFLAPFIQAGKMQMPIPKGKEILDFVFGAVGIPEGAERFFSNVDQLDQPMPPQPPPPDPKAQVAHEKNQIEAQKAQMKFQTDNAALQQRREESQLDYQRAAEDRQAAILAEHMKAEAEIRRAMMGTREDRNAQYLDHAHQRGMAAMSTFHDILRAGHAAAIAPEPQPKGKDK